MSGKAQVTMAEDGRVRIQFGAMPGPWGPPRCLKRRYVRPGRATDMTDQSLESLWNTGHFSFSPGIGFSKRKAVRNRLFSFNAPGGRQPACSHVSNAGTLRQRMNYPSAKFQVDILKFRPVFVRRPVVAGLSMPLARGRRPGGPGAALRQAARTAAFRHKYRCGVRTTAPIRDPRHSTDR